MYVDYEFYKNLGGQIPENLFPEIEVKAEAYISYFTYFQGDIFSIESERVKLAVCSASDAIYRHVKAGETAGIKSESNDGYSVTYIAEGQDGQTAEEILRKKVYESIRVFLLPTGWLNRRVSMGGAGYDCTDCDYYI